MNKPLDYNPIDYPTNDDYSLSDEWFPWAYEYSEYAQIVKSLEAEKNA